MDAPFLSILSPTHFQLRSSPTAGVVAWQVSKPALLWSRQCGNRLWALPQPGTTSLGQGPLLSQELFWNEDSFPEKCSSKINITSRTHKKKTQRFHSHWHFLMRKKKKKSWWKVTFWLNSPANFHSKDECLTLTMWSADRALERCRPCPKALACFSILLTSCRLCCCHLVHWPLKLGSVWTCSSPAVSSSCTPRLRWFSCCTVCPQSSLAVKSK